MVRSLCWESCRFLTATTIFNLLIIETTGTEIMQTYLYIIFLIHLQLQKLSICSFTMTQINDVFNPANRYFKVIKRNHNIGRSVVGLCVVAALCWPQVGTNMSNVLFTQVMTSSPSPRVSGGAFTALGIMGKTLGEFQIKPAPAFASRYNAFWDRNV